MELKTTTKLCHCHTKTAQDVRQLLKLPNYSQYYLESACAIAINRLKEKATTITEKIHLSRGLPTSAFLSSSCLSKHGNRIEFGSRKGNHQSTQNSSGLSAGMQISITQHLRTIGMSQSWRPAQGLYAS